MYRRSARNSNLNLTSQTGRTSGRSDSDCSFHNELTPLICRDSLETIPDQFEDIDDNHPNTDENSDRTLLKAKDSSKKVEVIYESPKLATENFLTSTDVSTTQKVLEDRRFKDIATNTSSDQHSKDTATNTASVGNIPSSVEDLLFDFHQKLLIYEAEKQGSFYSLLTDLFNNKATTPSLVSKAVSILAEMCLEKPFWSEVVASHYNGVVSHKVYGKRCKEDLFNALQKIYSEREVYQKENSKKFANSIIMIGQIFLRYRSGGYRRFKLLSEPLCVLLRMLCQSSEAEDMKLLVNQISLNGPGLQSYCCDEYEDILLQIRLKIMNTDDDTIRLWSLLGLDVAHYGTLLPKPVKSVYKAYLGKDIFKEMKPPSEAHLYKNVPSHLSQYYKEQN